MVQATVAGSKDATAAALATFHLLTVIQKNSMYRLQQQQQEQHTKLQQNSHHQKLWHWPGGPALNDGERNIPPWPPPSSLLNRKSWICAELSYIQFVDFYWIWIQQKTKTVMFSWWPTIMQCYTITTVTVLCLLLPPPLPEKKTLRIWKNCVTSIFGLKGAWAPSSFPWLRHCIYTFIYILLSWTTTLFSLLGLLRWPHDLGLLRFFYS